MLLPERDVIVIDCKMTIRGYSRTTNGRIPFSVGDFLAGKYAPSAHLANH
jgi:hypothetical protein